MKKRNIFTKYGDQARLVLEKLLEKYSNEGLINLSDMNILNIPPFSELGTPVQLIESFGGKERFKQATRELQEIMYQKTG